MKQEQPTIEGLKFCKKCGQYKPLSEFYRCSTSKDKLHFYCKQCVKKLNGEHSRQQRERIRKRIRDNQKKEHEKTKEKSRARYESNKEKLLKYSMTKYYSTDYLEKKYLKRYKASLEKVLAKKAHLENSNTWKEEPTFQMKTRMQGYEAAIEKWKTKIREAEELIALYAENKTKAQEEEKLESTKLCPRCGKTKPISEFGKDASRADGTQSCCKECAKEKTRLCRSKAANNPLTETEEPPKEEQTITKEQLIALLADVPGNAQIIYVGDTDSRSSLVAAWRPEPNTVCIRNLTQEMPYVITEGALYNMVSASTPFINEGRRMGQED